MKLSLLASPFACLLLDLAFWCDAGLNGVRYGFVFVLCAARAISNSQATDKMSDALLGAKNRFLNVSFKISNKLQKNTMGQLYYY